MIQITKGKMSVPRKINPVLNSNWFSLFTFGYVISVIMLSYISFLFLTHKRQVATKNQKLQKCLYIYIENFQVLNNLFL